MSIEPGNEHRTAMFACSGRHIVATAGSSAVTGSESDRQGCALYIYLKQNGVPPVNIVWKWQSSYMVEATQSLRCPGMFIFLFVDTSPGALVATVLYYLAFCFILIGMVAALFESFIPWFL